MLPFVQVCAFYFVAIEIFQCHANVHFQNRSFVIDYENNRFLKDGKPYRYIAGSLHYFRIPDIYWFDRLNKLRAAGLNAVQTYVPWNVHEPLPKKYNFDGMADVTRFLKIAQDLQLSVILRPGPYICAEWENGGLPWWLFKDSKVHARTSDSTFMKYVVEWLGVLSMRLQPFLYKNGGPIIMVQVENEYGSFHACDKIYMASLAATFRKLLGDDTVLFTTDGAAVSLLKCGTTPGVYPTVDFGPTNFKTAKSFFAIQRSFALKGPLVNSEFYSGWFDQWSGKHSTSSIYSIVTTMEYLWFLNASYTFYLFHGGTNFGFMNGASARKLPVTTSYDYDAPLSEAGDVTAKYMAIRTEIEKLTGKPSLYPLPSNVRKVDYGRLKMNFVATLTALLDVVSPGERTVSFRPLSFENLNWPYGFVLYQTTVFFGKQYSKLTIAGLKDRAYVIVDGKMQAILSGIGVPIVSKVISAIGICDLKILVENMGRENFGYKDHKGITGDVALEGVPLYNWIHYRIEMENLFRSALTLDQAHSAASDSGSFSPSVYEATFLLNGLVEDTFFHPHNFTKGQLYVNGYNVGRFWPSVGPQVTLYVPKMFLKPQYNKIILLELEMPGRCLDEPRASCTIELIDKPIFKSNG